MHNWLKHDEKIPEYSLNTLKRFTYTHIYIYIYIYYIIEQG